MIFAYSHRRECQAAPGSSALLLHNLHIRYPRTQQDAVDGVSFEIQRGTRTALMGHNGSGKSTLMKAVCGILPLRSGTVKVYGLPIGGCHHRVAFLPQRGEINWRFPVTVERLVLAGRYVHLGWLQRPGRADHAAARTAMERMGILQLADRQIGMLSGGQQQRALLARALAQDAELLLLDEPLSGVDKQSRQIFSRVLNDLVQEGRTVIMATHDTSEGHQHDHDEITENWDTVIELSEGKLVQPSLVESYSGGVS